MGAGADWTAQVRRGVLELCVLGLIREAPAYGYDLASRLAGWEALAANEGTLYPLLHRLQKEGLVEASWQASDAGPVRKYYRLTDTGAHWLDHMQAQWRQLAASVTELLERGADAGGSDGRALPT